MAIGEGGGVFTVSCIAVVCQTLTPLHCPDGGRWSFTDQVGMALQGKLKTWRRIFFGLFFAFFACSFLQNKYMVLAFLTQ